MSIRQRIFFQRTRLNLQKPESIYQRNTGNSLALAERSQKRGYDTARSLPAGCGG